MAMAMAGVARLATRRIGAAPVVTPWTRWSPRPVADVRAASSAKKAVNSALTRAAAATAQAKNGGSAPPTLAAAPAVLAATKAPPAAVAAPKAATPAAALALKPAPSVPVAAAPALSSAVAPPPPPAPVPPVAATPTAPVVPAATPKNPPSEAWADSSSVARVYYENENAKLVLDLPNASACVFSLNLQRDVNYLLLQIQDEDPAISPPALYDADGHRVARSTLLADALRPGVSLVFDRTKRALVLPTLEQRTLPLRTELNDLRTDFDKLQELKNVCDKSADSGRATWCWQHANRLIWGGFFGLCAQWGLMMRLTWYEYSWDVMEPISYFISFGTGILGYMFYVITRKDYTFENLGGTTTNRRQRLEYRKRGLDLDKYVRLQASIQRIETQLDTLRRDYAGGQPRTSS